MSHLHWLIDEGFERIGGWKSPGNEFYRNVRIGLGVPGIYVFVVGDEVCYVGQTTHLGRSICSYNRSFPSESGAECRRVHDCLRAAWQQGKEVSVWELAVGGQAEEAGLEERTRLLIEQRKPRWNVA